DGDGDPTNDDTDDDGTPDYLDPDQNPDTDEIIVNQYIDLNGTTNTFLFILNVERVPNNRMRIYNRWGVLVYEGENYNNINNVFNGRSTGRSTLAVNDFLPAGVYYYIFEYENEQGNMITDSDYFYINSK
ncbi:T9SS type B sorting domain-containing protein, partial [Croceitalea sp. MTPC5]|uniref:T9SS type B sorting domain-containing protein n=1 Tax=Croceitalea sp. MTPC5 TaxID=3056565 RepID=UPI0030D3BDBA